MNLYVKNISECVYLYLSIKNALLYIRGGVRYRGGVYILEVMLEEELEVFRNKIPICMQSYTVYKLSKLLIYYLVYIFRNPIK